MIYYFLPDPGIFGGVKVACQFLDIWNGLGGRGAAVFPKGTAPDWFQCQTPILRDDQVAEIITEQDFKMITWPPDYERVSAWPGKMTCHCQGTDDLMYPIFSDRGVSLLTCWDQAARFVKERFNRDSVDVSMSISGCFFFDGRLKMDNLVTYMPRRGYQIVRRCMRQAAGLDFKPIHALHEHDVANLLKRSGVFLATAEGEQFGLPALEAMAAGCLVISVPVKGGMEYLEDGYNCLMTTPEEMPARLQWIMSENKREERNLIRTRAIETAFRYHPNHQKALLARLIETELSFLKC